MGGILQQLGSIPVQNAAGIQLRGGEEGLGRREVRGRGEGGGDQESSGGSRGEK